MKKNIATILAAFVFLSAFAGCAGTAGTPSSSAPSTTEATSSVAPSSSVVPSSSKAQEDKSATFKTMADVLRVRTKDNWCSGYDEHRMIYVFETEGIFYRAYITMKKDVFDKLQESASSPGDSMDKRDQIYSSLAIDRCENLSSLIPKQEELDKLIGKTGKDLFDAGWGSRGFSLEDPEGQQLYAAKDLFEYTVIFEGKYEGKPINWDTEEFDEGKYFSDKKVKSVKFRGVSDAAASLD